MRHALFFASVVMLLACGGLLGTPLEQVERGYTSRIADLTEIENSTTNPELKKRATEARVKHEAAYAAVPSEEDARADAIGLINIASRDDIRALEAELEVEQDHAASAAAAQATVEKVKLLENWKGRWRSDQHILNIAENGGVHYENNSGSMKKTLDVNLVELTEDTLVIGALGMNSTFKITQQPTKDAEGTWTMKLDDVVYVWLGL